MSTPLRPIRTLVFGLLLAFLPLAPAAQAQEQEATQQRYGFDQGLPAEFICSTAQGCTLQEAALRLRPGGQVLFETSNPAYLTYSFQAERAAAAFRHRAAYRKGGCTRPEPWPLPTAQDPFVDLPQGEYPVNIHKAGLVCVRWYVDAASDAALVLRHVTVYGLSAQDVSAQMIRESLLKDVQQLLDANLEAQGEMNRSATEANIDRVSTRYRAALIGAAQRFVRVENINFEASLAAGMSVLNQSANPESYSNFDSLMVTLEQELAREPVMLEHFQHLKMQLEAPRMRLQRIFSKANETVRGILQTTTFGMIASNLKSLFALTFNRSNLETQLEPSYQVSIPTFSVPDGRNVKGRDLKELTRVLVNKVPHPDLEAKVVQGRQKYGRLSSLLDTLSVVNAQVNGLNSTLAGVAATAGSNESDLKLSVQRLLALIGVACSSDCEAEARGLQERDAATGDAVMQQVEAYFDGQRQQARSTQERRNEINARMRAFEIQIDQVQRDDGQRYLLMVEDYRSFFVQVQQYLDLANNPFPEEGRCRGGASAKDQPTNHCAWQVMALQAAGHINTIFPKKFDARYILPKE